MNKQALLLRHAKSDWNDPSQSDADRPLNERGVRAAHILGDYIAQRELVPDRILCSTATRAMQTGELVSSAWKTSVGIDYLPQLYMATPETIIAEIREADQRYGRVLVIGHNPGMAQAIFALVHRYNPKAARRIADKLPTAGFAVVDLDATSWSNFQDGRLVDFQSPKTLT